MRRQVGNKSKQLLSNMTDDNRLTTWAIIGPKGAATLFMPTNAFVCKACAGKVRKAQSVSNSSVPRPVPVPVPVPEPIIIISVLPPPPFTQTHARTRNKLARPILCVI